MIASCLVRDSDIANGSALSTHGQDMLRAELTVIGEAVEEENIGFRRCGRLKTVSKAEALQK
jgi:hypothetical protein